MPCSCLPACGCISAAACAGSACVGAGIATSTMAAMRASVLGYHEGRWAGLNRSSAEATPEEYEMAHAEFLDQKVQELHRTQTNLSKVQSLHPIPVIRSARRLRREIAALQARETRLAHEISALEG